LLGPEQKHGIKEQWTFGREFFMMAGPLPSESQLILLLQAFSIFKHRQQSGLRLVLPFSIADHYPSLAKKIDQYKYRSALVMTGSIEPSQVAQLAGAAYALVAPGPPGSALLPVVQAWHSGIPLLALPDSHLSSIANGSVLFAADPSKESLATIMMQIYKDESLRLQLIRYGQQCRSAIDIPEETARLHTKLLELVSEPSDHAA
ncbi:MAG: glycosyltransferase, partial [Sphingomonadales bacterium]